MDIPNYIESGILEEFVLGYLSEREAETVFSLAEKYPEIMAEINSLENTLGEFAMSRAIEPPNDLLGKVMNKINETAPSPTLAETAPRTSTTSRWLLAAAVIGLIGSLCLNIYFSYWLKDTQEKNQALIAKKDECLEKYENLKKLFLEEQLIVGIAKDPSFKRIIIPQTEDGKKLLDPRNEAIVFWSPNSFEVKVMTANLPPLQLGKQYKLWAIEEGQEIPVDKGVFEHSPTKLQNADPVSEAKAFAVSIENEGEKCPKPCGPIVLMGFVS